MSYLDKLPEGVSFELYSEGVEKPIFSSSSHWLYPLFEAEDFLVDKNIDREKLAIHDTVAGTAAAALALRLGIEYINADLMSEGARAMYEKYGATYRYGRLVERIECRTESLLDSTMSLDECYEVLRKRAGR